MIDINNLTTNPVDEELVKKIAKEVLVGEKKERLGLSIAFVGQGRMQKLNKRYRGKNRTTDVLAFSALRTGKGKFNLEAMQKEEGLGEIVVSPREIQKNAKRCSAPYEQEFARVIIHGILHLLGYNHEKSEKEAKVMFKKQEYYLSS